MPRFSANLSSMYSDAPFLDRFGAAAEAGFWAVECRSPYATPAAEVRRRLDDNGLSLVLIDAPAGDWTAGERGLAALPGRERAFREGMWRAVEYADAVDCRRIHVMAGVVPPDTDPDACWDTYLNNLCWTAGLVEGTGTEITLEPIGGLDVPGYLLASSDLAVRAIDTIRSTSLYLQYDIYHGLRMDEVPADVFRRYLKRIRHVQVAGNVDEVSPVAGGDPMPALFGLLDDLDYDGWVGCRRMPRRTCDGLVWAGQFAFALPAA